MGCTGYAYCTTTQPVLQKGFLIDNISEFAIKKKLKEQAI